MQAYTYTHRCLAPLILNFVTMCRWVSKFSPGTMQYSTC